MEPSLAADLRAMQRARYWALLGIEVVEVSEDRCSSRITVQEHHLNFSDVVHGGVISSLIDSVCGMVARAGAPVRGDGPARRHSTTDLHVQYLAGGRGPELLAHGRIVRRGRNAVFTEADVFDGDGRLIARGSATFVIIEAPGGRPGS